MTGREGEVGWAGLALLGLLGRAGKRKEGGRRRWVGLERKREREVSFVLLFFSSTSFEQKSFEIQTQIKFGCYMCSYVKV